MQIGDLNILFGQHPEIELIRRELERGKDTHVLVSGLHASARGLAFANLAHKGMTRGGNKGMMTEGLSTFFIVMDNAEAAQYMFADLKTLSGEEVYLFPAAQKRRAVDEAAQIQRTECLAALTKTPNQASQNPTLQGKDRKSEKASDKAITTELQNSILVVTYPEAMAESVPAKEELNRSSLQLRKGEEIQVTELGNMLSELGFERVDFVFQPGQYAIRGGIVDIYSYSHDNPYRLDFFGDEIDSIREFDIEDQLSKNRIEEAITLTPGLSTREGEKASIVDYLPEETVWVSNDWSVVRYKLESSLQNPFPAAKGGEWMAGKRTIEMAEKSYFPNCSKIAFDNTFQSSACCSHQMHGCVFATIQ